MRKTWWIVVWVLVGAGMGVGPCLGAPSVAVSELVYNFGVVVEGEDVVHDFVLSNVGDEELVILGVYPTCGCTTTALGKTRLAPREDVRLGVRLSTVGDGGRTVEKQISIETNDPAKPRIVLSLRGTVVKATAYLLDAEDLSGQLVLLIDVREPSLYARGHLVGAVNLPYAEAGAWSQLLPMNVPVVLYDADGTLSGGLAEAMLPLGYMDLHILTGGFNEWVRLYGERLVVTVPFLLDLGSTSGS
jgi:rhodanese-related sulfurtransferase